MLKVNLVYVSAALLVLAACSNPAADKPAAQVGEAAEPSSPAADAAAFMLDESSEVGFVGSKVTGSHDGGFRDVTGTITITGDDPATATVDLAIDMNSIWSDTEKLTDHLKSADFFEVETYPTSTFQTTKIEPTDDGYLVTGNLAMHGVTNSITFPATITVDGDTLTADAEFSINRRDWEINYDGKANDLIRDEVVITFDINATKS